MTDILETRFGAPGIELRAKADGIGVLAGYAIVYNSYSRNLGGFVEQVAPGAVDNSLRDQARVSARFNHDSNLPLGTTEAGTLRLESDDKGLHYEVDLPDTGAGRDVRDLAGRGDLRYSSFAFYALEDEWSLTEQDFLLRTLLAVQLVDVAPVLDPAYLDTSTGLRSADSRSVVRGAMCSLAERTGLGVDVLASTPLEEIRARITGEQSSPPGPGATHPGERVSVRRRRLQLAKQ